MNEKYSQVGKEEWIDPLFRYLKDKSDKKMHAIPVKYDGSAWQVMTYNILSLGYNVVLQRATPRGIEKYTVTDKLLPTTAGYRHKDIEFELIRPTYEEHYTANDQRELLFSVLNTIIELDLVQEPEAE